MWQTPCVARWLAALLLVVTGCKRETGVDSAGFHERVRPDIILVSIDSLRADHTGCYGYEPDTTPTIDGLARAGARFLNTVSTTSWTLPAHAALFTGLYDSAHGLVDNGLRLADEHVTLAEILRDAGYNTAGFFGGPYLHPTFGLHQGFTTYLSCMTTTTDNASGETIRRQSRERNAPSHRDITGPRILERFTAWLGTADDRPMFIFLHMWDVHYDYIPPRRYIQMFDPDYRGNVDARQFALNKAIARGMPARDLQHVIALYDGEIRFTDDILGQIFAKLAEAGRLDRALVIVTSDHGEEFFEHGGKGHHRTLFEEVARVPLIIHWPRHIQPGTVISDQVRIIDIMPTVLASAGLPIPVQTQGRDLGPLLRGAEVAPEPALLELLIDKQQVRALRTNDYKVVVDERRGRISFFDLRLDPGETKPAPQLTPRIEQVVTQLKTIVQENRVWREGLGRRATKPAEVSDEMMSRLRSLGYVGDEDD